MVTWIIWKIKSWFCDHDFEYDEINKLVEGLIKERVVSRTCKKCGWHVRYSKYGNVDY